VLLRFLHKRILRKGCLIVEQTGDMLILAKDQIIDQVIPAVSREKRLISKLSVFRKRVIL
jgi:hypothetical protein